MARITNLIYGSLLVALVVSLFMIFLSNASSEYNVEYDNSSLASYEKMQQLTDMTNDTKQEMEDISESTGVLDIIGDIFGGAVNSLKLVGVSFDIVFSMSENAAEDLPIGEASKVLMNFTARSLDRSLANCSYRSGNSSRGL